MAQKAPIADHTVAGAALTSMLRDKSAAVAANAPRQSAVAPNAAERTSAMNLVAVGELFMEGLLQSEGPQACPP
jgi:hypothetical protein